MKELDTSFDIEEFERKNREDNKGFVPAISTVKDIVKLMPKKIRESPTMKAWIEAVTEIREGETKTDRKIRLQFKKYELYGSDDELDKIYHKYRHL